MINLLPQEVKERYKAESLTVKIGRTYLLIAACSVTGIICIAIYLYSLNFSVSDKQSQLSQLTSENSSKDSLTVKAATLEDRVNSAKNFQEQRDWAAVLNSIASATPSSIVLSSIKASAETAKPVSITIVGSTANRRDIILFGQKLQENKNFPTATLQGMTDSATEPKKINFTIVLTYKD